jgi:hypothetical protein
VNQTRKGLVINPNAEGKQQKNTKHSPARLEDHGCIVLDTALKLGEYQAIITSCGFAIPMLYKNALI